ncbi:MAG: tRNA (adenosine(37)-N6)-threonylcarbamoyltransferase complex dimerization subunit type 1 TsaB [Defluviitaleaceae bacterium]|nr:tRNA (adenosine(37)-N6)-threonylcarbamoyltransferase complex dimerization subunit type 1 TsaB [Defluviitaleaceae bacterium]
MLVLAADTSEKSAGAALVDGCKVLAEVNAEAKPHSETLMPIIDKLFALTGKKLCDVDLFAATSGPGSFTGLRIGAATVMGLADGTDKPLAGVPTLLAMAHSAGAAPDGVFIVPMMDAKRSEVYAAVYKTENGFPVLQSGMAACPVTELLHLAAGFDASRVLFTGEGADIYREEILKIFPFAEFAAPPHNRIRAASVALCALREKPDGISLTYLRKPQAERERDNVKK